ncbi:MAG: 3-dehydroquinate synthase [Candidatus Izemoplasma sp.]|nr:3-dehydroquinate synthase [Candidatus Izemoplasma sp.]
MKKVFVKTKHHTYTVYIEHDLLSNITPYLPKTSNYILISDDNIPKVYYETIHKQLSIKHSYFFKAGEQSKSLPVVQDIIEQMIEDGVTKDYVLIALGGGVVGDLAGFIASVYLRGIDYVQIPTTLLAQVDSSVGGKTAVNSPTMKNAIGAYKHPKKVLIDPKTLNTLENRHFNNGMAEIIKYGLISDSKLFHRLNTNNIINIIDEIIATCVAIKARIVYLDEKDQGVRQLLNYGHTIGHAIEQYSEYELLHGESIAIAMHMLAKDKPFEESLTQLLRHYNLPLDYSYKKDAILKAIKTDKKVYNDHLNMILVDEVGNGYIKTIKLTEINNYLR